ncbi:MAG TPA: flagellar biosynthetic protein FliO [Pseudothermotoga sp.]
MIGFLGIVYFIVKRRNIFGASKNIKVLERHYIDKNCSVVLVRVMENYFFLLVTPNSATILKELSQSDIGQLEQTESFSHIFFKRLGRREKGTEEK